MDGNKLTRQVPWSDRHVANHIHTCKGQTHWSSEHVTTTYCHQPDWVMRYPIRLDTGSSEDNAPISLHSVNSTAVTDELPVQLPHTSESHIK